MPTQDEHGENRLALLVIRASVEAPGHRLVVRLLEVDAARTERLLEVTDSPRAASRLVLEWLSALVSAGPDPRPWRGDGEVTRP